MIKLRHSWPYISGMVAPLSVGVPRREFRFSKQEYKRNIATSLNDQKVIHRQLSHKSSTLDPTKIHMFGYPVQPIDDNHMFSPYIGEAHTQKLLMLGEKYSIDEKPRGRRRVTGLKPIGKLH